TLEMEIRDAATGTIINSLAPPTYNGSYGTCLIPEEGIASYVGNDSWLLTPTQSGPTFGNDSPFDLAQGNFGVLGHRLLEAQYADTVYLFGQNGLDFTGPPNSISHAASYSDAI